MKNKSNKIKIKLHSLFFIISAVFLILAIMSLNIKILCSIFFIIFFLTLIIGIIIKISKSERNKEVKNRWDKETKWVFEGSAGWLLFWLIFVYPIGIIYLLINMGKKEVIK